MESKPSHLLSTNRTTNWLIIKCRILLEKTRAQMVRTFPPPIQFNIILLSTPTFPNCPLCGFRKQSVSRLHMPLFLRAFYMPHPIQLQKSLAILPCSSLYSLSLAPAYNTAQPHIMTPTEEIKGRFSIKKNYLWKRRGVARGYCDIPPCDVTLGNASQLHPYKR